MTMTHPGLPPAWCLAVLAGLLALGLWGLFAPVRDGRGSWRLNLSTAPGIGPLVRFLTRDPRPLLLLKLIAVALFLLVIAAGLLGSPIPRRNLATVLTWNLWWSGVIVSVFFLGSAWCAVCPLDTLANWLVRHRLWRRGDGLRLNLRPPKFLRTLWPAVLLFAGLSWLELGFGVSASPYETALMALLMVLLATVFLALFERRAFCRWACPVGRTIGFYSQLAPVELRPVDSDTCARCTTLECYHGSETIEGCPTSLVMGRLKENTYCISCGNCPQSCPHDNVAWRLRPPSVEAAQVARSHPDEAAFLLVLLALTGFHGLTMLPPWEQWVSATARLLGDSGQLLLTFSLGMSAVIAAAVLIYALTVWLCHRLGPAGGSYADRFEAFSFIALPLAFAYHLAHNLNHLLREGRGLDRVLANPFGTGTQPLSMMEKHLYMSPVIPQELIHTLQAALLLFGFWLAVLVIRHRGRALQGASVPAQLPLYGFAALFTGFHLWLLAQPMVMRM